MRKAATQYRLIKVKKKRNVESAFRLQLLLSQKLIKSLSYLIAYILGELFIWIDIDDILFGAPVGVKFKVAENTPALKYLAIGRLYLDHTAGKLIITHGTRFYGIKVSI